MRSYPDAIAVCLLLLLGTIAVAAATDTPTCLDDDGKPVDWFIVYKIPVVGRRAPFSTGYAYAYITSDQVAEVGRGQPRQHRNNTQDAERLSLLKRTTNFLLRTFGFNNRASSSRAGGAKADHQLYWTISSKLLSDSSSMVQRTMAPAFSKNKRAKSNNNNNLNFIFYNDQPPEAPEGREEPVGSSSRAHAKGAVLIDDDSGDSFWLTHSTPHYPPYTSEELKFASTSRKNGQTFMCLNFNVKTAGRQIVDHLVTMFPLVYESHISQSLEELIPEIGQLSLDRQGKKRKRNDVVKLAQVINTRQNQELYLYSKSSKFGEDLYTGWISHEIRSPLYVESWRIGSGTILNSSCPKNDYHVNNVKDMHVVEGQSVISWPYSKDHSKWAITDGAEPGVVCITDINRNEAQFTRGGGAVCIKCATCWQIFSKTIEDLEPCPRSSFKKPEFKKPESRERSGANETTTSESEEDLIEKFSRIELK